MRLVVVAAAAIAVAFGLLGRLIIQGRDQTCRSQRPFESSADPGDGSLPNGGTLTPFDVQHSAIGAWTLRC